MTPSDMTYLSTYVLPQLAKRSDTHNEPEGRSRQYEEYPYEIEQ